eukprot:c12707_g2_i1 orf=110-583(+)
MAAAGLLVPLSCPFPPFNASSPSLGLLQSRLKIEAREPTRTESAKVRELRVRKQLIGTAEKPRLLIFCSEKHLYVQVIDDSKKHTIVSASTLQMGFIGHGVESQCPIVDAAKRVGEVVAKECLQQGISKVAFCRRGSAHKRRVQAFKLAVQSEGLMF